MIRRRKFTPEQKEARRVKNREGMRKIRQRQRQELLELKTTIVQLETQYDELCQHAGKQTEPQKAAWRRQIQRALDFESSSLAAAQQFKKATTVELDTIDEAQAEEELGFHPLTEWDLTRAILANKREICRVESRLQPSTGLLAARNHRMQAFGWDIV
ncbi:hypothetical protein PHYSODRAFT_319801 [Phytophthora sojae]|uniref:BZIP domain-containing protein n=1 Tax=Phytophthora sojae (strain P6497) TaxID=1094619 RepID=G5ADY5_PHYSP|nr:hypothetical protein PHYSODRAFT_319801 [Phytophthora sojae]EGZ06387.1 hypothetical protein PHYSODRAFT_319801 [Phytophthora sojae]|eukprot:XP_009538284.1 hypothetical protein PHYSODRAFT_319801 [Phytophthora sojae]